MQDKNGKGHHGEKASLRRRALLRRKPKSCAPQVVHARKPQEPKGYDPELLYVECGRCGAPVLWEPGRASKLMEHAGVDPLELDASCMLVTDSCPACGDSGEFSVRICRVSDKLPQAMPPTHGHA